MLASAATSPPTSLRRLFEEFGRKVEGGTENALSQISFATLIGTMSDCRAL